MDRLAAFEQTLAPGQARLRSRLEISERRLLLVMGDLVLISLSIAGSLLLWSTWAERLLNWSLWQQQAVWAFFIFVGWMLWLRLSNLYNLQLAVRLAASVRRILTGGLMIALAYLVLFFITSPAPILGTVPGLLAQLTPTVTLPRLAPGMAILSSTGFLLAWRITYACALRGPQTRRRVLILGAGRAGTTLHRTILREHSDHYHVVGFIDDDPGKHFSTVDTVPVLGGHDQLTRLAQTYRVDDIIVAISAGLEDRLFQAIIDCHERGVNVTPMPLLYERLTGKIAVEHIGSQWYTALPLQRHAASSFFDVIKRINDILFGLIGGLVFVLLCPWIALAIRLDSPGPVFYLQERAGIHGRRFWVRKFRSMVQNAEGDGKAQWAIKNDQRITRVGKFLRKTRLDELPQVINVLRGEMSLVGPRPERPQFIDQLQHQIPFYRTRLAIKPGLTGWAQVNYGYGSTVEDALIKLQYDLYYIKHQAPWLDLLIMLRTIGVVLRMKGQ
jgi:exopolysaccharide biosynthesis polyprenyl glycosylphosphotransferase